MIHNHLLAVQDEEKFSDRVDSALQEAEANFGGSSMHANRAEARVHTQLIKFTFTRSEQLALNLYKAPTQ